MFSLWFKLRGHIIAYYYDYFIKVFYVISKMNGKDKKESKVVNLQQLSS